MTTIKNIAAAALFTLVTISSASAQIRDRPSQAVSPPPRTAPDQSTPPPSQHQPFLAPEFVSAISSGPLALLNGDDRQAAKRRMYYVVGFSLAADKTCDFLTVGAYRELLRKIAPAVELARDSASDQANEALLLHLSAGIKDGTAFIGRNACGTVNGRQIMRSLAALWESV